MRTHCRTFCVAKGFQTQRVFVRLYWSYVLLIVHLSRMSQSKHDSRDSKLNNCLRRITFSNVIITICTILLTFYCAYNITLTCMKYIRMDTIVSLENNPPIKTPFPGITICAPSIFKPEKLAELYPDTFGVKLRKYEQWRRSSSVDASLFDDEKILKDSELADKRIKLLREFESKAMQNFSALEIIRNLSVQRDEVLGDCKYYPINIRKLQARKDEKTLRPKPQKCDAMVQVLESIFEGKKCFTIFSDLHEQNNMDMESSDAEADAARLPKAPTFRKQTNSSDSNKEQHLQTLDSQPKPKASAVECSFSDSCSGASPRVMPEVFKNSTRAMHFDLNPSIELVIKAIENDVWSSFVSESTVMTVHPPNILPNRRDFLFFQVMRNNFYEIAFSKKTTHLLPPRCVNYLTNRKYMDLKTRDSCITICILGLTQSDNHTCANYYSVLVEEMFNQDEYKNQTMCPHEKQNYSAYLSARAKCEEKCPVECLKTIFEITGQFRSTLDENIDCPKWYEVPDPDSTHENAGEEQSYSDLFESVATNDSSSENAFLYFRQSYLSLRKLSSHMSGRKRRRRSRSVQDETNTDWECNARVSVRISAMPFTTVRHQPAMTMEGYIGSIGGHLGIWLGLSLFKVIKFVVHLLYNFFYRMIRKCVNRRKSPK